MSETEATRFPSVVPAGECAILIEFGDRFSPGATRAVAELDAEIRSGPIDGLEETVPGIASLQLRFDPFSVQPETVEEWCRRKLESRDWYSSRTRRKSNSWAIPTVYGGAAGPELAEVADQAGLREDQVVDAHSGELLQVVMLGFAPGTAYLAELPESLDIARRKEITPSVPAGSILVAVRQTVLPGIRMPTAWSVIGRTPLDTFRPRNRIPFLLSPGDSVRFEAIRESRAGSVDSEKYWNALGDELP